MQAHSKIQVSYKFCIKDVINARIEKEQAEFVANLTQSDGIIIKLEFSS